MDVLVSSVLCMAFFMRTDTPGQFLSNRLRIMAVHAMVRVGIQPAID